MDHPYERNTKTPVILVLRLYGRCVIRRHLKESVPGAMQTIQPKADRTFIGRDDRNSDRTVIRADYISIPCQYRPRCFQCKPIVKSVQSLIDEIADIQGNEVLGVCAYCKRANPAGKCRRCEYVENRFPCNKVKQNGESHKRFMLWLSKVNQFLHSILDKDIILCKNKLHKDEMSPTELEKLLHELKLPLEKLASRQPDITYFPMEPNPFSSITQSKEMIEELLIKINSESLKKHSSNSLFVTPSDTGNCVCKYLNDRHFKDIETDKVLLRPVPGLKVLLRSVPSSKIIDTRETTVIDNDPSSARKIIDIPSKEKLTTKFTDKKDVNSKEKLTTKFTDKKDVNSKEKLTTKFTDKKDVNSKEKLTTKFTDKKNVNSDKDMDLKKLKEKTIGKEKATTDGNIKEPEDKQPKKEKTRKEKLNSEDQMLIKLIKKAQLEKEKVKATKQEKPKLLPKIKSLPQIRTREVIEVVEEKSESIMECDQHVISPKMIKGIKVVPFDHHYKDDSKTDLLPLLYRVDAPCSKLDEVEKPSTNANTETIICKGPQSQSPNENEPRKRIVHYALSDPEFIKKGWTVLPTTKIMRRMNIYKMEPAYPQYDWFERYKYKPIMYYECGEKLAEIFDNGRGKWFYKNGMVALDYYNSEELHSGQRYVVYSSGEESALGKCQPVTVLASFDFLGNGIVYDQYGVERLKYNQSEGLVVDAKVGPPGRWKWHSLNDPPQLQTIFINTYDGGPNTCISQEMYDKSETITKQHPSHDLMLAIELDNFAKEKSHKLLQKFKPYKIRTKVVKLNDQFSLRILDQANINLRFKYGSVSFKVNLGMALNSCEIVDSEMAEVTEVPTPYDRVPPKSQSVADIQQMVLNAKRNGRTVFPDLSMHRKIL